MKITVATDLTAIQKTQPLVVGGLAPNRYAAAGIDMILRLSILLFACSSMLLGQSSSETGLDLWFAGPMRGIDLRGKDGQKWYGLYEMPTGFELSLNAIKITDVDGEVTQAIVSTDHPGDPLFLFRGLWNLREGPVKTAYFGYQTVLPGQEFRFQYSDKYPYSLKATGKKVGEETHNYELVMLHRDVRQVLYSIERAHPESMYPTIRWIGDFDRDGKPDIFFMLSARSWSLMLSSFALQEDFLREVATECRIGD